MRARGAVVGVLLLTLVASGSVDRAETADSTDPEARATGATSTAPTVPSPTEDPGTTAPDDLDLDLDSPVRGPAAIEALGDDLAVVAERNGLTSDQLAETLQHDDSVGIDPGGALFVAESADEHDSDHSEEAEPSASELVAPLADTFELESRPGSTRTILLDFDGLDVQESVWSRDQGVPRGLHPGFTLDSDPTTFTDAERTVIQRVWAAVAEDFAIFDVNVTTKDPGDAAITRSGPSDNVFGARAFITSTATFPSECGGGCAGIAYVGTFDSTVQHAFYQTAWIKGGPAQSNPSALAIVVSHEIGHNLGLHHARVAGVPQTQGSYYGGHDNWGPIMGSPYQRALTQWTDHADARLARTAAQSRDDLTTIRSNGLAVLVDEAPSTVSGAPALSPEGTSGVITSASDTDVWRIGTCSGTTEVTVSPALESPNLDVSISLLSSSGGVVATNNPVSGQTGSWSSGTLIATGVGATLSTASSDNLSLVIDGVGVPGRYSDFGSVGEYTVTWTCEGTVLPPTDPPPTDPPPTSLAFTDVPPGRTFYREITWLAGSGVTTGYLEPNGTSTFRPAQPVLREQMAAFLYRFDHDGANPSVTGAGSGFRDVPVRHPFAEHIRWLSTSGVTTGYDDGTFRPAQPVLREQMAAFLYRLNGASATARTCGLVDVPASHRFAREICWLKSTGITTGYTTSGGTQFRGSEPVLREQMAAFLYRFDRLP